MMIYGPDTREWVDEDVNQGAISEAILPAALPSDTSTKSLLPPATLPAPPAQVIPDANTSTDSLLPDTGAVTQAANSFIAPEAGAQWNPATGTWGTWSDNGGFTPSAVQPSGGKIEQETTGTNYDNQSSNYVYKPLPTTNTTGIPDSPWAIDYSNFESAVKPFVTPGTDGSYSYRVHDGDSTIPSFTLANGKTLNIGGAANEVTFHPKGSVIVDVPERSDGSGGMDGGPNITAAQTHIADQDTWTVNTDASDLYGTPDSNKHVSIEYIKVGDKLVPKETPNEWNWANSGVQGRQMIGLMALTALSMGLINPAEMGAIGSADTAAVGGAAGNIATGAVSSAATSSAETTIMDQLATQFGKQFTWDALGQSGLKQAAIQLATTGKVDLKSIALSTLVSPIANTAGAVAGSFIDPGIVRNAVTGAVSGGTNAAITGGNIVNSALAGGALGAGKDVIDYVSNTGKGLWNDAKGYFEDLPTATPEITGGSKSQQGAINDANQYWKDNPQYRDGTQVPEIMGAGDRQPYGASESGQTIDHQGFVRDADNNIVGYQYPGTISEVDPSKVRPYKIVYDESGNPSVIPGAGPGAEVIGSATRTEYTPPADSGIQSDNPLVKDAKGMIYDAVTGDPVAFEHSDGRIDLPGKYPLGSEMDMYGVLSNPDGSVVDASTYSYDKNGDLVTTPGAVSYAMNGGQYGISTDDTGTVVYPGEYQVADGIHKLGGVQTDTTGVTSYPDGSVANSYTDRLPEVTYANSNDVRGISTDDTGVVALPDGTVINPDGKVVNPDGKKTTDEDKKKARDKFIAALMALNGKRREMWDIPDPKLDWSGFQAAYAALAASNNR